MVPKLPGSVMASRSSPGFTLIELLIVIVILGILAAILIPRYQQFRQRAHFSAISSDFKNFGVAQEQFRLLNDSYALSVDALEFEGTAGVQLQVTEATATGWSAVGTHAALSANEGCAVYLGDAEPPTVPGGGVHSLGPGVVQCRR